MRLLEGHDATVAKFVADLAPIERPVWPEGYRAFGVIRDDGALVGGVVFSNWKPAFNTLELSGAALSRHAFGPQTLLPLGEYAFEKLGAYRVWALTSVDNKPARAFLRHIGFTEESVQAHHYGRGKHAITLRIIPAQWQQRWGLKEVRKAA